MAKTSNSKSVHDFTSWFLVFLLLWEGVLYCLSKFPAQHSAKPINSSLIRAFHVFSTSFPIAGKCYCYVFLLEFHWYFSDSQVTLVKSKCKKHAQRGRTRGDVRQIISTETSGWLSRHHWIIHIVTKDLFHIAQLYYVFMKCFAGFCSLIVCLGIVYSVFYVRELYQSLNQECKDKRGRENQQK